MTKITKGSCNCGGVTWEAKGEMRPIVACHCGQCRKQSGLFYAATASDDVDLQITGEALKWYHASAAAKRGFCVEVFQGFSGSMRTKLILLSWLAQLTGRLDWKSRSIFL